MHPFILVSRSQTARYRHQTGSSLIEFSIVAIPLLLVGLGSIEIAQWFFVKQAVSLALTEAARAGITRHASPDAIEAAFEYGLLPLYPATATQTSRQRLQQALARRSDMAMNLPPWQIEILSPTERAFRDFNDPQLTIGQERGLAAINNNYQAEQDQRHRARGWPNGLGPVSNLSIYQANTLTLKATYLHEPTIPGLKSLIRLLPTGSGSYAQYAMANGGYLPVQQEIQLTMQSHALNWPEPANRKVIKHAESQRYGIALPAASCQGIWCLGSHLPGALEPPTSAIIPDGTAKTDTGAVNPDAAPGIKQANGDATNPAGSQPDSPFTDLTIAPDDPACGVTLCCPA